MDGVLKTLRNVSNYCFYICESQAQKAIWESTYPPSKIESKKDLTKEKENGENVMEKVEDPVTNTVDAMFF